MKKLEVLAERLKGWRKEAVEGRWNSGIEEKWRYAEDAYNGEDEATKARGGMRKPLGPDGGSIGVKKSGSWRRSTAFLNITRPYVDVASARIADMIAPTDDRNWELKPTPKREIEKAATVLENAVEGEVLEQVVELVEREIEKVDENVREVEKQIDDWLVESGWNGKLREVIWDAARIGTGIVKGPVPVKNAAGDVIPGVKLVKAQNLFPDPNCGVDIHDGDFIWEREEVGKRRLREFGELGAQGWISEAIGEVLKEGPKSLVESGKRMFELWHFQGEIEREVFDEVGVKVPRELQERKALWAHVSMVNDWIVRLVIAPVQGEFTYRVVNWQRRDGHWAGIGIAEQLETVQRGLNATIRNLFDNAALSALPQLVFMKGVLHPVNGRFELSPGKIWEAVAEDRPLEDVRNAIIAIELPSRQAELMEMVALMRDVAQETTGLPLVVMGQRSTGAVGSDQLMTNAATVVLRRLAKEIDERLLVPMISAFYQWVREYDVMPVREAVVQARGSSVLVERDIQAQALIQMVQIAKDPVYGIDPEKVAEEWLRSQKFDPKRVKLEGEKARQLEAMVAKPDEKAQATVESAKLRAEALAHQADVRAQTHRVEARLDLEEAERKRQHDERMLELKYRYELVKYATERGIDLAAAVAELDKVKVPETSAEEKVSSSVSGVMGAPPSPEILGVEDTGLKEQVAPVREEFEAPGASSPETTPPLTPAPGASPELEEKVGSPSEPSPMTFGGQ